MKVNKVSVSLFVGLAAMMLSYGTSALAIGCGDRPPFCGHPLCPCPSDALSRAIVDMTNQSSTLEEIELDPVLNWKGIEAGHLSVQKKSLNLTLLTKDSSEIFQVAKSLDFAIVSAANDCGSTVITGNRVNWDTADIEVFVVADHRGRVCRDLVPHVTTATYEVKCAHPNGEHKAKSYFGGTALVPILE